MVKRICCWLKNKFAKKELALPEHAWLVRSIELPDGSTMVEDGEFIGAFIPLDLCRLVCARSPFPCRLLCRVQH